MKTNKSAKTKIGKLKKQKTKEIKVSRGVTVPSIPIGQGKKGKSTATAKLMVGLDLSGFKKKQAPLQNGEELKPIMIKPNMGRMVKPMAKFPDLSGDGKVTKKDILIGRGVIKKPKMQFDGDKKLQQQLQNAVVLDNVDFGLDEADLNTASTIESLRKAFKGNKSDVRNIIKGKTGNIKAGSFHGTGVNKLGFTLKDRIRGNRAGDRLLIDTKTGEISRPDGAAVTPYLRKIGINPRMINKPKMKKDTPERLQIKKTGRDLQNALNKEKSKPMTEQDKRVINQLQGAIEEQKKKLKTNKTKPTMIKKKAKMIKKPKLGKKPKMGHKKPSMMKKPKLGKKPTMAKKPKMGHKKPKMGHKKK